MSRWPYVQTPQSTTVPEKHHEAIPAYALSVDEHAHVLGRERVLLRRVCSRTRLVLTVHRCQR